MRYILIFVGAAVVASFLALGIRAFNAERRSKRLSEPSGNSNDHHNHS